MSGKIGDFVKVAEACQTPHMPVMAMEKTNNFQVTSRPFPFLKLPAEIRNAIYRLVLLTQNVTTSRINNSNYRSKTPVEGTNVVASTQAGEVGVGTVRCKSWWVYTLGYQISILRANRQIYREAWGIFHLENFWTIVRVNKTGFGKEMKERGFPVATAGGSWRQIRFPVMNVEVTFPSLNSQKQSEAFLMVTAHLKNLMRALWTAKGASEMEVMIHIPPPLTNHTPSEGDLLQRFFKLRGIKRVALLGALNHGYMNELRRAITTTDGMNQSIRELKANLKKLQRFIKAEQWGYAIPQTQKQVLLLDDCKIVYGKRLIGIEPGITAHTAIARSRAAKEMIIATSIAMAEVALYLCNYATTIHYADRALYLISRVSVPQPLSPAFPTVMVPPYHQLPPLTGTITFNHETYCAVFLVRARAYIGLRQDEDAFRDIETAGDLMPNHVMLDSVCQAWQDVFGPFQRSAAPSPTSYSASASATASADAVNDTGVD